MKQMTLKEVTNIGRITPNTIIHGECIEAMSYIDSQSINMICCDLPYG